MSRPSSTVAGPCLRMARSGGGATTWVVTVEVSSFGVWSWGTLAVLVTVPTAVGWTVTVTGAALAPGASDRRRVRHRPVRAVAGNGAGRAEHLIGAGQVRVKLEGDRAAGVGCSAGKSGFVSDCPAHLAVGGGRHDLGGVEQLGGEAVA